MLLTFKTVSSINATDIFQKSFGVKLYNSEDIFQSKLHASRGGLDTRQVAGSFPLSHFITCDFLSPLIFHQMESLLVNEFLKMSSAHYNKVNSFICMFSITDTKSVAPSKAIKHILNLSYIIIHVHALEGLYILCYLLLNFLA